MIQETRNRIPDQDASRDDDPSHDEIHELCRQIRARWTARQRQQREIRSRIDAPDLRFEAHLRFVEFLLTRSEPDACSGRQD